MNANIFSCTVPPLLVLETQIIHPELLQSLCINPCGPLEAIFFADVCACRRVRARRDGCARVQTDKGAREHVYARPYPSLYALTRLHALSLICARAHLSARALRQRGFTFDTSASLKLPKVKKKIGKKIITRRCPPKEDGRTSMSVRPRPKPTSEPP